MKVLVNEDPEALKTVATAKGGLGLEFTLARGLVSEKGSVFADAIYMYVKTIILVISY